jgi:hypothetical protein
LTTYLYATKMIRRMRYMKRVKFEGQELDLILTITKKVESNRFSKVGQYLIQDAPRDIRFAYLPVVNPVNVFDLKKKW